MDLEYLTTQECADIAKMNRQTVSDAVRSGTLKGGQRKKHGPWRIERTDLKRWLDGLPALVAA